MKPLLLGEAPARTTAERGATPMSGLISKRLAQWSGILSDEDLGYPAYFDAMRSRFEMRNLLDFYPGAAGRGAALPRQYAEPARDELLRTATSEVILLLGARLARLFGVSQPRHKWDRLGAVHVAWIYHPSGLTRQYNDPEECAAAGLTVRRALELAHD